MVSLVGRADEIARLLAAVATVGSPGAHRRVVGPAGIGKTSLVEAVLAALDPEALVLRCRGVESEMQVPFVGLSDLVAPIIDRRRELSSTQARALAGAIAIDDPAPGEPLAVRQAALNLIRLVAMDRPVVIFADDLPSMDPDSRDCLAYVARRVPAGVTIITAGRTAAPEDSDPREPHHVLGPLTSSAARALVRARRGTIDTTVLRSVVASAHGNPLALALISDSLTDRQAAGLEPLRSLAPRDGSLGALFAPQLDSLAPADRIALLVAALSGTESRQVIAEAAAHLGLAPSVFTAAETAALIRVTDDRLTFTHPLIHQRVVSTATDSDRRDAHVALASTGSGYVSAWHRAVITKAPDEEVAAALEAAGHEAVRRRALDAAVAAFRRSDELTPDPERAMDRLAHAIRWSVPAGHADLTVRLVADGVRRGATGVRLAQFRLSEALAHHALDRPIDVDRLITDAERVAPIAPMLAAWLYTSASIDLAMRHRLSAARDAANRAIALAPGGDGAASLAYAAALAGDRVTANQIVDEARSGGDGNRASSLAMMNVRIYLEDDVALLDEIERGLTGESIVNYSAPFAASIAAEAAFRVGRWTDCARLLDIADDLADAVGAQRVITRTLVLRARLAAASGAGADARRHLDSLRERSGDDAVVAVRAWYLGALGFSALTAGDAAGCITALEPVLALATDGEWREPCSVPWAGDLVEAYLRERRVDDAQRVTDVLAHQADATGSVGASAVARRCQAMVGVEFAPLFEEALLQHQLANQPFETARTHLAYGESLYRSSKRALATDHFTRAATIFDQLGAQAWARRARDALQARPTTRVSARPTLTAAEVAVATHAGAGRTNREIASLLFISTKTVETHLGAIYRKLGVRGRVELARVWSVTAPP